jgi:hypothetical protein
MLKANIILKRDKFFHGLHFQNLLIRICSELAPQLTMSIQGNKPMLFECADNALTLVDFSRTVCMAG